MMTRTILAALLLALLPTATSSQGGPGPAKSHVFMVDHSVIGAGLVDETPQVLASIGACATINPPYKGCILVPVAGAIIITGPIPITFGGVMQGAGPGAIAALPGGVATGGGTSFITTCKTCDLFVNTSLEGFTFRDLAVFAPLDATDGHLFRCRPFVMGTEPPNYRQNIRFTLENVRTIGGMNVVAGELCSDWSIRHVSFWSARLHGIVAVAHPDFPDQGNLYIEDAKFWFLMPHDNNIGGACILIATQSTVTIRGVKCLSAGYGLKIVASQGRAGILHMSDSSIEETKLNAIKIEQASDGKCGGYGLINIHDVQIAHATIPQAGDSIRIEPRVCDWGYIDQVKMHNIDINHTYTAPVDVPPFFFAPPIPPGSPAQSRCMSILDGTGIEIHHIRCNGNNVAAFGGIRIGGMASEVYLEDNVIRFVSALPKYELFVQVHLRDHKSKLTVAEVGPMAPYLAPGSTLYLVDGRSTSWPANPSVQPGGVGCLATVNSGAGGYVVCSQP